MWYMLILTYTMFSYIILWKLIANAKPICLQLDTCCMFRSAIIAQCFRINSTENWNSDQKKGNLQDTKFWTLEVLLSQMETNLNFVLLAQFYIPMCTKWKCSSLLAWNKDDVLKSSLEKILQLMYACTCWSTYTHI